MVRVKHFNIRWRMLKCLPGTNLPTRCALPRRNRSRPDHRRTAIAQEAARIIQEHGLKDFRSAKEKAGLRLGLEDKGALPSNQEIESAIAERNRIFHGETHEAFVDVMRQEALDVMRQLGEFDPRLVGPVLTGSASEHSTIDLHVFSDTAEAVGGALAALGLPNQRSTGCACAAMNEPFAIYSSSGDFEFAAIVFPERGRGNAPLSPVDGRPMRRATAKDVEQLLSGRG
jgi:hypothetical protein